MSTDVTPFRIAIPEDQLRDLRERLQRTRWPERETVDDWSQGIPLAYLKELCAYWADGYDWRATEARLNARPQFRTELDGLGSHCVHVRSPHKDALPLVISHGWPGSIVEFLKVIGPLADPTAHGGDAADAFHVLCPSLPGYGFSDKPAQPGWKVEREIGAATSPRSSSRSCSCRKSARSSGSSGDACERRLQRPNRANGPGVRKAVISSIRAPSRVITSTLCGRNFSSLASHR